MKGVNFRETGVKKENSKRATFFNLSVTDKGESTEKRIIIS